MMQYKIEVKGRTYAADAEGRGVFELVGGGYIQHRGTGQTPKFRSEEQFRRYVQRMTRPTTMPRMFRGGKARHGEEKPALIVLFKKGGGYVFMERDTGKEVKPPRGPTQVETWSSDGTSGIVWTWKERGERAWSPNRPHLGNDLAFDDPAVLKSAGGKNRHGGKRVDDIRARAKWPKGYPLDWHRFSVDEDGTVRIWDDVAGHYVESSDITPATERRIRSMAAPGAGFKAMLKATQKRDRAGRGGKNRHATGAVTAKQFAAAMKARKIGR